MTVRFRWPGRHCPLERFGSERGQSLVEYVLILSLVSIVVVAAFWNRCRRPDQFGCCDFQLNYFKYLAIISP